MPITSSLRDGVSRVLGAPVILAGAAVLMLSLALPVHEVLDGGTPSPTRGDIHLEGASHWWSPCAAPAVGVARSLASSIIGCTTQLAGLTPRSPDIQPHQTVLLGYLLGCVLVLWTFLSGGFLDRFARGRPTRTVGFFAACGLYGSRLIRLGLIVGLTYGVLFGLVQGVLFGTLFPWLADGISTAGQTAVRIGLYLVFGLLVGLVGLVFDYARVRAVVEDRRSMVGAVLAGWRFVRRRPVACASLYAANGLLLVAVVAATPLVPVGTAPTEWLTLAAALLSLVARCAGRLLFYASETAYFQNQLAHVGYVAAPTPVWPESPASEALGRLG